MARHSDFGELFDPKADLSISAHFRPHWSQSGAIVFITFRTADSIPKDVLRQWEREKQDWLLRQSGSSQRHWSEILPTLDPLTQARFKQEFNRRRECYLDTCQGECVLRNPILARIVADTLLFFDGERYRLGDFVVMPNHVHLLASFPSGESMTRQCDSWMHFSAWKINRQLKRKGKFWQQEPFDHLVRSPEQYQYLRRYIRDNGCKAGLGSDEYLYRQDPASPLMP